MSAPVSAKECCLGAVSSASVFSPTLVPLERQGEVLEKHLGSTRGSKELFVAWGSSRVFN